MKKTLAMLLALLMVLTAVPALAASSWVRSAQKVETWDREVDFVIVGFGMAGTAAAVEAHEVAPDAKIAIFEKSPSTAAGGNAIGSGQCILFPDPKDIGTFQTYMKNLNYPQVLSEENFQWLTNEMADQLTWIEAVCESANYEVGYSGGGPLRWGSMVIEFEDIPGSNFRGATGHLRKKDGGVVFENGGCWNAFAAACEVRGIAPEYETPVIALIQDPESQQVIGVIARQPDGKEISVKADKGVLLACGGYENNMQMLADYNGGDQVLSAGSPYNTGDGIKMLQSVGAQMWHMDNHTMSCGYFNGIKVPDYPTTFIRQFYPTAGNWLEVGANDQRFYNESKSYQRQHMKYKENGQYVDVPIFKSLPVSFIFDETMRTTGGPIVNNWIGYPATMRNAYAWSQDNSVEIEKGWIVKGDTIEELATKLNRDPAVLKATIDRYNELVDKGVDEDFGRKIESMAKIETAPFYAVNMNPTLPATSGGAKRDIHSRVLDWDDRPIPGLYEAGELGSFVCNLYQNGTYLAEAIASGRAAINTAFDARSDLKPSVAMKICNPWDTAEDGTYSKFVEGLHEPFEVRYTVEGGKLTKIESGEGRANMFMNDEQFAAYTQSIIEQQDMAVDAISGATTDSQAISSGLLTAFKKK
ncbi:MAG: FAD-binding protein [Clostridia bacterium]